MRRSFSLLIVAFFSIGFTSGCISDGEERGGFALVVDFEKTNGTIVEKYEDGDLNSKDNVSLVFDFSRTEPFSTLSSIGVEILNTGTVISGDPFVNSAITVEFSNHGMYNLTAYAIDHNDRVEKLAISVRVELHLIWLEIETYEPVSMLIDSIPKHGGDYPSSMIINSEIINPAVIEDFSGGGDVEITWHLLDQMNDACQSRADTVSDGDSIQWKTAHFNTLEVHELSINYDEGQDAININQSVKIEYLANETLPSK